MKTLTVDDVMALGPCGRYPREAVEKLFGRRKKATPKLVVATKIPEQDRLWLLLKGWMDDKQRRLLAADIAEHVLPNFEAKYPEDKRPRTFIYVVRRFARGEATEEERAAAYASAYAAYAAAYAAAAASAAAASDAAASDAAAYAAARVKARAKEWSWILRRAVKYAEGKGGGK